MAKLSKAKRGKNRWIGIIVTNPSITRSEMSNLLELGLQGISWKLFDFNQHGNKKIAIIRTMLEDASEARDKVNSIEGLSTTTTSGKIRLVRERLSQ
ncbi:MAG: hypothetical protein CL995_05250 [Euryarchaeota archaeon]|jgi:hypothetical protein|nr:hypothetical protein [Euryarchaeota archaeon]MEC7532971.1 hypothetical protein [Candidatus Thermoplasmatota archaeon]